jgi:hypothetical protein
MIHDPIPVSDVPSALLYLDFLVRFSQADSMTNRNWAGIAAVIRDLTRRLEEQALASEREEAKAGK